MPARHDEAAIGLVVAFPSDWNTFEVYFQRALGRLQGFGQMLWEVLESEREEHVHHLPWVGFRVPRRLRVRVGLVVEG